MGYVVADWVATGKGDEVTRQYTDEHYGESKCGNQAGNSDEQGFQSMTHWDMFAPLFFTIFSTSVGLMIFQTCPYASFDTRDTQVWDAFGTHEDQALQAEIMQLSASELHNRALNPPALPNGTAPVDQARLDQALDLLCSQTGDGNSAPLLALVLENECSEARQRQIQLLDMPVSGLVQRATAANVRAGNLREALDDIDDVKTALIAAIVDRIREDFAEDFLEAE